MLPTKRNPVPLAAGRASKAFCSATERAEDKHNSLRFQARTLVLQRAHRLTEQADFVSLGDVAACLLTKLEARRCACPVADKLGLARPRRCRGPARNLPPIGE
jgi:hypothetical protein